MLQFAAIEAAAARLQGVAHRTPVLTSTTLDDLLGAKVFLKAENLQRMGAFKFRGGYNTVNSLTDPERARGVVAFSSGNHAQAVALAARLHGCRATIVMPHDAPALKVAAPAATARRSCCTTDTRKTAPPSPRGWSRSRAPRWCRPSTTCA